VVSGVQPDFGENPLDFLFINVRISIKRRIQRMAVPVLLYQIRQNLFLHE
jgi:hypothetical protein